MVPVIFGRDAPLFFGDEGPDVANMAAPGLLAFLARGHRKLQDRIAV